MPVKRALHMGNAHHHSASKIPAPVRRNTPLPRISSSKAGKKTKVITHEEEVPQRELENFCPDSSTKFTFKPLMNMKHSQLDSLRSKLEQSADAFIKARNELEEIFSAEGSSQQGHFLAGSFDLKTELQRHRELTSRVESSLKGNKDPKNHSQGFC